METKAATAPLVINTARIVGALNARSEARQEMREAADAFNAILRSSSAVPVATYQAAEKRYDAAEAAYGFRRNDVEQALRIANPVAAEADLNAALLNL